MTDPAMDVLNLSLRTTSLALLAVLALGIGPTAAAEVTGTAAYLERIALPPDAAFEATLEDVSRADAPSMVLGRATVNPAGQVPIRFAIPYDPAKIVENHRYVVRGRVVHKGELLYTTTSTYPVLTRGAGHQVELRLQRPGARPKSNPPAPKTALVGTQWNLTQVGDLTIDASRFQRAPGLQFDAETSRFAGSGGCNSMTGPYKLDGPNLAFGMVAGTMMMCPDEMMKVEQAFGEALRRTAGYRVTGRRLELLDAESRTLARFEAGS